MRTHGLHGTQIYSAWKRMKDRCKHHDFYLERGIRVCKEWETFEGFYKDMSEGFRDDLSLDRINNLKGYSKGNCRWATFLEQQRNRSSVHSITFNGETLLLSEWAQRIGMKRDTLDRRINRLGWTLEEAFGIRPHLNNRMLRKKFKKL